jgi:hypothetical protein
MSGASHQFFLGVIKEVYDKNTSLSIYQKECVASCNAGGYATFSTGAVLRKDVLCQKILV